MAKTGIILIGTYTDGDSQGIYGISIDRTTGQLGTPWLAGEAENPSFLTSIPPKGLIYAVSETARFDEQPTGSIGSFSLADYRLNPVNRCSSGGPGPCHISLDASSRTAFVSNYIGGSLCTVPIGESGPLLDTGQVVSHEGKVAGRRSHVHCAVVAPSGGYLLVADLGLDRVFVYRLDTSGEHAPPTVVQEFEFAQESGPRHMAFHPSGQFVYVACELNSTVAALEWDPTDGRLGMLQAVSALPAAYTGKSFAAEVQAHPSGRFLFTSNRGHDTIAAFCIDSGSGLLKGIGHFPTGGRTPRHFAMSPCGRFLVVANQDSDTVTVFAIDCQTGGLRATGSQASVPCPACVHFL